MKIKLKPIQAQTVVIFGASSGIGRITALDFAKRGAKVAVASRNEAGLASLVVEIKAFGGEAFYMTADAADFNAVKAVADQAFERYGSLDTWVHCAGTMIFASFEKTAPEEFKRLIEVNLLGQVYGAMAALPLLRKTGGGALIHVTSVEAYRTVPFQSAYGSSKHGVKGFLQALRVELQAEGVPIAVSEIMPGAINTPIWDNGRNKFGFRARPPVPPIYHPQIVSDAILYAAANEVREMVAGGGAVGVPLAERFSPRLTDKITLLVGLNQFDESLPLSGEPDGLFEIVPGPGVIEGRFSATQLMHDPYTWAKTNPRIIKPILAGIGGLLGSLLVYKILKGPRPRKIA